LIAVSEEDREEKFGVCGSLEDAVAVESDGCECEGLGLEAHEILTIADEAQILMRGEEGTPQGLKPRIVCGFEGPG
jgi:hypothetical protein